MSNFQTASVLVAPLATILPMSGLHLMQKAYASDFNNAELFWNGTAWLWSIGMQAIYTKRTDTTPQNTTTEHDLWSVTLPKLGKRDTIRLAAFFTFVNSTQSKRLRIRYGPTGSTAVGLDLQLMNNTALNLVTEMRNQAAFNQQEWFTLNSASPFGLFNGAGALATSSIDSSTGTNSLAITLQKNLGTESVVMNWADIYLIGGGV